MTCTIHHFPAPPAYVAQLEAEARRQAIVAAERAVLRSAAWQSDEALTEACNALKAWGDWMDHLEAEAMLLAMRLRASRRARDAKKPARAFRLGDAALILSAAFALGMIGYVTAKAQGWW